MIVCRDADSGLTLIETLIVLVIMAIMAGVATLTAGVLDPGRRAGTEASLLAIRLGLAVDEALVTARPQAMVWDEGGYRFLAWNPKQGMWSASAQPILARRHDLPSALRLESERDPAPIVIMPDLTQGIPAMLRISGSASASRVAFDGFAATVSPMVR